MTLMIQKVKENVITTTKQFMNLHMYSKSTAKNAHPYFNRKLVENALEYPSGLSKSKIKSIKWSIS